MFRVQDRRLTTGLVVENGRLVGLKVAETKIEGRKAEPIPGSEHELRAPLVISSIGSVPEVLPGVAMKGEYYTFTDEDLPRYTGSERVFGVGNVVTGQGNIRVSLVHSQKVTNQLIEGLHGHRRHGRRRKFSAILRARRSEGRRAGQCGRGKNIEACRRSPTIRSRRSSGASACFRSKVGYTPITIRGLRR